MVGRWKSLPTQGHISLLRRERGVPQSLPCALQLCANAGDPIDAFRRQHGDDQDGQNFGLMLPFSNRW
jgi:hypothetical protein